MSSAAQAAETLADLTRVEGKAELIAGRIVYLMPTGFRPGQGGWQWIESSAVRIGLRTASHKTPVRGWNMPALSTNDAAKKLANVVETAKPSALGEIYTELFPEQPASSHPSAGDIAQYIRNGLEAEEIVDLWNVVFPEDRNVRYDEETKAIHYNEEMAGYAD